MKRRPIIAIDGAAGSGKSTVGKRLARSLGLTYVDTGAMYRAIGLRIARCPDPEAALLRAEEEATAATIVVSWDAADLRFRILLDGEDVSAAVRTPEAALWASRVAQIPGVRRVLVAYQRGLAADGGVVMEGRDIGTVVFPTADFKFFLEADLEERARRRHRDEGRDPGAVARDIGERDERDSGRSIAPLKPAADAERVDTTELDPDQVVARLEARVRASLTGEPGGGTAGLW